MSIHSVPHQRRRPEGEERHGAQGGAAADRGDVPELRRGPHHPHDGARQGPPPPRPRRHHGAHRASLLVLRLRRRRHPACHRRQPGHHVPLPPSRPVAPRLRGIQQAPFLPHSPAAAAVQRRARALPPLLPAPPPALRRHRHVLHLRRRGRR
uniref:Uncharacterized protein n=1 Tax=Setaria viridis TaxID=4556 RepID=A0A4U6VSV7_SETVI|nr:hypothetical protein SEVIR_2G165465v2 [Setaria viridis]